MRKETIIYYISDFIDIFQYSPSQIQGTSFEAKSSNKRANKTNINSSANEIVELRKAVEICVCRSIKTPTDFDFLANIIRNKTNNYTSSTTLKRIWNYIDGYNFVRRSSLQILVHFLGFNEWEDFLQLLKEKHSSQDNSLLSVNIIVLKLSEGALFELNFEGSQFVSVEYIGEDTFQVVKSVNASWQAGDKLHIPHAVLNRQFVIKDSPTDK